MIAAISYPLLQEYWWAIISLLGALLVFLMFVQGGQSLLYTVGKTEMQRTILVNSLGRKWEFTFTTLVTFGGAFFASFPLFYATSFGGAYWVWMLILFSFILQAVSYEFRSKPANFLGSKTYEVFLIINGLMGTILIGTAVGTFFNGAQFSLNDYNQVTWETEARGLEAVLNIHNVALGLTVFFLTRVLALQYFNNSIDHKEIAIRVRMQLWVNSIPFLVFFLYFITALFLKEGFAYDPDTMEVFTEKYKYMNNLMQMPLLFVLFLIAGYNNTCYYPSAFDLQSSINIRNSSSSEFTLRVMSIVSIMVPFVVAYIWFAWRAINTKKIDENEMNEGGHKY